MLNAVPEVPPITAPHIPGVRRRGPTSLGGLPVGTVVRVSRAGDDELYVCTARGCAAGRAGRCRPDPVRRLARHDRRRHGRRRCHQRRAVGQCPSVGSSPDRARTPKKAEVVFANWRQPAGDTTLIAGLTLPLAAGRSPVALVRAEVGTQCRSRFRPARTQPVPQLRPSLSRQRHRRAVRHPRRGDGGAGLCADRRPRRKGHLTGGGDLRCRLGWTVI